MRAVIFAMLALVIGAFAQQATPNRPKITGIDHVDFYTTNPDGNSHLYTQILGLASATPLEAGQTQRFIIGDQWVGFSPAPDPKLTDRMDHLEFATDDCEALRKYLAAEGVHVPESVGALKDGIHSFKVKDPENHVIDFVERSSAQGHLLVRLVSQPRVDPISRHLIHAGFIVRDRAAEDHFYKDILGFHLYWHGGMKDSETDWVAMQVPDGTDWLEYMLNIEANPSLKTTGVLNHISLGVTDMKQAQAKLESHGWKPHGEEKAQMGKDGKWQLNVFDPDYTRVELMDFKPTQKPCCSEFQGPHPSD